MFVKIYKLGEEEPVNTFPLGSHVIGRGPTLQCTDKRVSRNHATVEITQNHVEIKSLHVNPCFLKAANSKTITILSKDSSIQLNDGDTFALLPDDYWFKIKIIEEDNENEQVKRDEVQKRALDNGEDVAPPDKKAKCEETNEHANNQVAEISELVLNQSEKATTVPDQITDVPNENDVPLQVDEIKSETVEVQNDTSGDPPQNEEISSSQDIKQKTDEVGDDQPGTSNPKPTREKCWYGAQCYRKNPVHRDEYKHPGDSDFETDPEDNRPICSFGATCYRKNKDHRRNYKHPPRQPPSQKKRIRKKVKRMNVADSEDMRDLFDSEDQDPFIADDDSDEYVGNSSEDDSDWDESQSQDMDDESENIKRLVKEANKFVKK